MKGVGALEILQLTQIGNRLMISMMWSGYNQHQREIVTRRVLSKYHNDLNNIRETARPIYRSREQRALTDKPNTNLWFRKTGATATFTVPYTTDSKLAKTIRKKLIGTGPRGTRVLVLEQPGNRIMTGIGKTNPFPVDDCNRPNYPVDKDTFDKECIVYQAICARCHSSQLETGIAEPIDYTYLGESSRTLYTRYSQHVKYYEKSSK